MRETQLGIENILAGCGAGRDEIYCIPKIDDAHAGLLTAAVAVESERDLVGEDDPHAFVGARRLDLTTQTLPCAKVKEMIHTVLSWLSIPA